MPDYKKKVEDFLSGKDSQEGRTAFDKWFRSIQDEQESPREKASEETIKNELSRIKRKPGDEIDPKIRQIVPGLQERPTMNMLPVWKVAAAVAVVAIAAGAFYLNRNVPVKPIAIEYAEKVSPLGKRLYFTLSDGSRIWLNADSRLRHPVNFEQSAREVYLEGEAYFEVTPDMRRPFIIRTSSLTTTVLGTSFNIRAYDNEEEHEVAVVTGKVSVHTDADKIQSQWVVERGQKATLNIRTARFAKEEFQNFDLYTAWKDGRLVFERAQVGDILQSLNRYYNTDIKVRNADLESCIVTTTFDNLSLPEILSLLGITLNATYEKEGDVYWLNGKGCAK